MAVRRPHAKTVAVMGGSGFLGRHLSARLVRLGYAVVIPTRRRARASRALFLPGIELRSANISQFESMRRALRGCDAVINLVGILNERGHNGSGFHTAHVELAENMMRACHDVGIHRVIQVSALKANAERGPSHYLLSKGQAEQVVQRQSGDEIDYTILRPSVIFGPDDSFINRFASLLRISPILPLARSDAQFSPVYVGDVVQAIVRSLETDKTHGRIYELCGPESFSLQEIVLFTKGLLGKKRLVVPLPDFIGRLQAAFCDYLVPGKPFSLDNFRSLTVASTCNGNGLSELGIEAQRLPVLVPAYFEAGAHQQRLSAYRGRAGR